MARDFLFWRHLRVVRARGMRHIFHAAERAFPSLSDRPVKSVYGVRMMPNWADRTFAYCHYGTYGSYLADLIGSLDQPFAFVDIGANQGLFSLIAGTNPMCKRIVALEPVPSTHARLEANLALNGLTDKALSLRFGLSDSASTCTITTHRDHSGLATLGDHLDQQQDHILTQDVEMRTVEALDEHLPADLPIFVKVDVEGHEVTVIEQLLQSRHADRIIGVFYEHDESWSAGSALEAVFERSGFATQRVYGRGKHFDALATPVTAHSENGHVSESANGHGLGEDSKSGAYAAAV